MPKTLPEIHPDTQKYNKNLPKEDREICDVLAEEITRHLPKAENKIWHAHPVWFLDGNPIVGYDKLKSCVRLLFWSGQSFKEKGLKKEGSFKAAEMRYTHVEEIKKKDLKRWLKDAKDIQWDYKNIVKRKGVLKKIVSPLLFSFLLIIGVISFLPNTAYACMGFGCKTDLAILGEVISSENNIATIKSFHVFPNSIGPNENEIKIEDTNNELQIGKKYALALSKKDEFYIPIWGILEIEGSSFENAKLLRLKNGDDASLQWWVNTNGKGPEFNFYGVDNKLFVRIGNSESPFFQDIQVYPKRLPIEHLFFIIICSFVLGSASTYFLIIRRKEK